MDWADNKNGTHTRPCPCNATETKDCTYDSGVVTKEATHLETGIKKFTCTACGATREETIAKTTEHTFGKWTPEETVVGKYYRECACGEREVADCTYDGGISPQYQNSGEFRAFRIEFPSSVSLLQIEKGSLHLRLKEKSVGRKNT